MKLSILYRGPLSSCNYGCTYCPFAKTKNTRAELADDRVRLGRFLAWVQENEDHNFGILFTPWGEALIRAYYREAIHALSHMPNVRKVSIQTNLSCKLDWLAACNLEKVALWITWHPTQISRKEFIKKCRQLDALGIRYSVGVVGMKESIGEIEALRAELPAGVYLWVNAYKRIADYYLQEELERIVRVDPLFSYNLKYHASLHEPCKTGETVFSVDGAGDMFRCHFIKTKIGNIYEKNWAQSLRSRGCTNQRCGCYIGYAHLEKLKLDSIYGAGILERIPAEWVMEM